jgi:hypothetical protein
LKDHVLDMALVYSGAHIYDRGYVDYQHRIYEVREDCRLEYHHAESAKGSIGSDGMYNIMKHPRSPSTEREKYMMPLHRDAWIQHYANILRDWTHLAARKLPRSAVSDADKTAWRTWCGFMRRDFASTKTNLDDVLFMPFVTKNGILGFIPAVVEPGSELLLGQRLRLATCDQRA